MADTELEIELRQSKYLNNLVEQNRRVIKRRTRPMLGFGRFQCQGNASAISVSAFMAWLR